MPAEAPAALEPGPYRSTVINDVHVSTIVRVSSALDATAPLYYETMAFPCSGTPRILWHSSARFQREADRQHDLASRWFGRSLAGTRPQTPAVHPDYSIALADYNAGLLPWPPCEQCCQPIPDAPFTGASLCNDCVDSDN